MNFIYILLKRSILCYCTGGFKTGRLLMQCVGTPSMASQQVQNTASDWPAGSPEGIVGSTED